MIKVVSRGTIGKVLPNSNEIVELRHGLHLRFSNSVEISCEYTRIPVTTMHCRSGQHSSTTARRRERTGRGSKRRRAV